ncbi:hypothetical protein COMNV_01354 [Commensalibacter sp. Nvir]|uniref:major capsid family protein n=1 Tax=Commensalibacter sp. Nvir TaxID=3069817 RepID=UPI002D2A56D8|nr:hypothetical protein COMNV_01354 [Commensalibacter sp. Nvir]
MKLQFFQPKSWSQDSMLLAQEYGIHFPQAQAYLSEALVNDASFQPITSANNGIPSILTTFIDPQLIDILIAPLKAAEIYGEAKKGDWLHDDMKFVVVEPGGTTQAYGDFSNGGSTSINAEFPSRQQFLVQTLVHYGDREIGRAGLANIDLPARQRLAGATTLNIWQNNNYFFGQQFLQNYGALNDPNLPAAITPGSKKAGGNSWKNATALEIFDDIQTLYTQLTTQTKGVVNLDNAVSMNSPLKLVLSNISQAYFLRPNEYGISAMKYIKDAFPNLVHFSAPQLSTAAGELVQLFVESYGGVDTFTCAFSEKLRSHGVVRELSSYKEKLTQGAWGTILTRPVLVAQMLGV